MTLSISSLSTQYIQVPVTALESGLPVNPTSNTVSIAFVLGRLNPVTADWQTGTWQTSSVNGQYFAQVLVGPDGAVTLTEGAWTVWLQVVASPETVIIQTGSLVVY